MAMLVLPVMDRPPFNCLRGRGFFQRKRDDCTPYSRNIYGRSEETRRTFERILVGFVEGATDRGVSRKYTDELFVDNHRATDCASKRRCEHAGDLGEVELGLGVDATATVSASPTGNSFTHRNSQTLQESMRIAC